MFLPYLKKLTIVGLVFLLLKDLLLLIRLYLQKKKDWHYAKNSGNPLEFIAKNKEWLQTIRIDCNLSPPHLNWVAKLGEPNFKDKSLPLSPREVTQSLKKLNVSRVRLSIYNNRIIDDKKIKIENPTINIGYYEPWLKQFNENNIKITLCTGVKTPRWPEIHYSKDLLNRIYKKLPRDNHQVDSDDPLSRFQLKVNEKIYKEIVTKYPDLIKEIQVENEPKNSFGPEGKRWTLNNDHIIKSFALAHKYFPEATLSTSTPATWNQLKEMNTLFKDILKTIPELRNKLKLGINYYWLQPKTYKLADNYSLSRLNDLLFLNGFNAGFHKSLQGLRRLGIKIYISELQAEPWYPSQGIKELNWGGNRFDVLVHSIIRCARYWEKDSAIEKFGRNIESHNELSLTFWGTEEFFRHLRASEKDNYTDEHGKIANLIKALNKDGE